MSLRRDLCQLEPSLAVVPGIDMPATRADAIIKRQIGRDRILANYYVPVDTNHTLSPSIYIEPSQRFVSAGIVTSSSAGIDKPATRADAIINTQTGRDRILANYYVPVDTNHTLSPSTYIEPSQRFVSAGIVNSSSAGIDKPASRADTIINTWTGNDGILVSHKKSANTSNIYHPSSYNQASQRFVSAGIITGSSTGNRQVSHSLNNIFQDIDMSWSNSCLPLR